MDVVVFSNGWNWLQVVSSNLPHVCYFCKTSQAWEGLRDFPQSTVFCYCFHPFPLIMEFVSKLKMF